MRNKFQLVLFLMFMVSCIGKKTVVTQKTPSWDSFVYPEISFVNKAQGTQGWEIYNRIVPDPEKLIKGSILDVVKTLYWSPNDSMPKLEKINYTFEDVRGISAKGGAPPQISIFYSSRWVEQSARDGDDKKVLYETEGVLYHELVHGFQLEPKGIGTYGTNKTFFAFIEGMADAVRAHNGYFPITNRKAGGNWMDGYQTTGFFLEWLTGKDSDFLRKFNKSALEVIPWSFNGAIKHVLGEKFTVEDLWDEYQLFLTEKKNNDLNR